MCNSHAPEQNEYGAFSDALRDSNLVSARTGKLHSIRNFDPENAQQPLHFGERKLA
jgi:hypothetical protein